MTTHYAVPVENHLAGIAGAVSLGDASLIGGKVHCLAKKVTLAATGDYDIDDADIIVWGELPKGAVPLFGMLIASATMGATATLDVGIAGTAAKFRAAAVFTAVDTPTPYCKAAAAGVALTEKATLQSVIDAADLPDAGTLVNLFFYTLPHGG